MIKVQVRELEPEELDTALGVVVRAMCDSPLHVKTLGDDPASRGKAVQRLQRALMESVRARGYILCAEHAGSLVGILGIARRKPRFTESIKLIRATFIGSSPAVMLRLAQWFGQWVRRQPPEPYWHVGPVAVDRHLQGRGIGTALMEAFCSHVDEESALAYLETDKAANERFYQKFGFQTIDEAHIIGVRNWFMIRPPNS